MIALELTELILFLLIGWAFVTQVALPIWFGLPLFPFRKRRWRRVQRELENVEDDTEFAYWKSEVLRRKSRIPGICEICGADTGHTTLLRCPDHLQKGHQ